MAEVKHTPGPWGSSEDRSVTSDFVFVVKTSAGEKLRLSARESTNGYEGAQANAALIAAAPDLYEALQGVLRVADRATVEFDAARAALAKAQGKE